MKFEVQILRVSRKLPTLKKMSFVLESTYLSVFEKSVFKNYHVCEMLAKESAFRFFIIDLLVKIWHFLSFPLIMEAKSCRNISDYQPV